MKLSRYTLKNINPGKVEIPADELFDLPEKVLQFGTGVLLRGLPDYFIDKANKQNIFNGRIVVVKSTDGGDADAFEKQDGLYSICIRGIEDGNKKEQNIICSAISRVLSAKKDWEEILQCAHNPHLQIILSNTTEVGIELVNNDDIRRHPPVSFPGKLLAFLYERYKAFDGSKQCGMVIVPTELIVDNGKKLEAIVTELAYLNGLDEAFIDWLENCNHFCNSLVDRIVPGKPNGPVKTELEKALGYSDELLSMSEVYSLWAIEGDEDIASVLSFSKADDGIVITKDIELFRELKLRLLNGTHILGSGIAFLAGFTTVNEAMDDTNMNDFITGLMQDEIAPAIPYAIQEKEKSTFIAKVLDRFRNPLIEHPWLSITMNYTSKMHMRVVPLLLNHYKINNTVPEKIALGFAAYFIFLKAVKEENGVFYGKHNGNFYPVKDESAGYFYEKRKAQKNDEQFAAAILKDSSIWGTDLSQLPGFEQAVTEKIKEINEQGMATVLQPAANKILA
jgi:tagaturonate reductase